MDGRARAVLMLHILGYRIFRQDMHKLVMYCFGSMLREFAVIIEKCYVNFTDRKNESI